MRDLCYSCHHPTDGDHHTERDPCLECDCGKPKAMSDLKLEQAVDELGQLAIVAHKPAIRTVLDALAEAQRDLSEALARLANSRAERDAVWKPRLDELKAKLAEAEADRRALDVTFAKMFPDWNTVRPPEGKALRVFLMERMEAELQARKQEQAAEGERLEAKLAETEATIRRGLGGG